MLNKITTTIVSAGIAALLFCQPDPENNQQPEPLHPFAETTTPPLGWNSYDSYGHMVYEEYMLPNLQVFIEKYVPAGYRYFVLDDGWQFNSTTDTVCIDSFGRCVPDPVKFPNGLKPIIDSAHAHGVLFGVWIISGAPMRAAWEHRTVKGTSLLFGNELDAGNCVSTYHHSYRFRAGSSAMQAYYNSVFELLAEWGVDFVKYDYITNAPADIDAVASALARCGRPIVLSLSAGGDVASIDTYRRANMVRTTSDVWDNQESIDKSFAAWKLWRPHYREGLWHDLDMIPFGTFMCWMRDDSLTSAQKRTFMAQRALAASPLFMGGALIKINEEDFWLTTDREMLACNQNGICGSLMYDADDCEVWRTPSRGSADSGWAGIFNRSGDRFIGRVSKQMLGLAALSRYDFYDIWNKTALPDADTISVALEKNDVLFIRYRKR
jgi:hypothetical protein